MPDIKTKKDNKGTIKTLDKVKIASGRMKSAYIQTKDKAEHSVETQEYSANEYATDRMESVAKRGAEETARQTKKQLGNAKDGVKMVKSRIKQRIENKAQNKLKTQLRILLRNHLKMLPKNPLKNLSEQHLPKHSTEGEKVSVQLSKPQRQLNNQHARQVEKQ